MCGIVSIFAYRSAAPPVDGEELDRIQQRLYPRGPDAGGIWISDDRRVAMGSRRLAIIDLSADGVQPMLHPDGSCIITFNGEIYNYREIRARLEQNGAVFRSHSDTEVLLHLYRERGSAMVEELRGMFAFALWDFRERRMLLARDPYGIKPLYFADDGATLRVASTVKALLAGGHVSTTIDHAGVAGFFLTGSVPEPFTTYEQIRSVPAGAFLFVDERGMGAPQSYFSVAAELRRGVDSAEPLQADTVRERIGSAVRDSVRAHFVADVPVGAFLSAGIDSATLVAMSAGLTDHPLQTITLTYDEYRGRPEDEGPIAARIASRYGARHSERSLGRSEFVADLPRALDAMDQPSIDGLNTWFVSKAAHEQGLKVALSGVGGDEMFGGYPSFRQVPKLVAAARLPSRIPGLGRLFRSLTTPLRSIAGDKLPGLIELGGTWSGAYFMRRGLYLPWELPELMGHDAARDGLERLRLLELFDQVLHPDPGTAFGRVAALEASLYMRNQLLRDTDWASMAHSLEVRTPLVDAWLLRALAPLFGGNPRRNYKRMFGQTPSSPLPDDVLKRPKTGFTIPIRRWLAEELGNSRHDSRGWAKVLFERELRGRS